MKRVTTDDIEQLDESPVPVTRRGRRSNPDLFGEPWGRMLYGAAGLAGTAWLSDKIFSPLIAKQAGKLSNPMNKALDGLATAGTAALLRFGLGRFAGRQVASDVFAGGMIGAGGKFLSAVVPDFGINSSFPNAIPFPSLFGHSSMPAADKAVASGTAGQQTAAAALSAPSSNLGVPHYATTLPSTMDVGL